MRSSYWSKGLIYKSGPNHVALVLEKLFYISLELCAWSSIRKELQSSEVSKKRQFNNPAIAFGKKQEAMHAS